MDRDGTGAGYDTELVAAVARAVSIPVIASGGVGELAHLAAGLEAGADAVLAASIFHFGRHTIGEAKAFLAARGIAVRPPDDLTGGTGGASSAGPNEATRSAEIRHEKRSFVQAASDPGAVGTVGSVAISNDSCHGRIILMFATPRLSADRTFRTLVRPIQLRWQRCSAVRGRSAWGVTSEEGG